MPYKPGDTLLNKYRTKAHLGQGAFGDVCLVTHQTLNTSWAVKVIRRDGQGLGSQDYQLARQRFTFEAQLGASIEHPNIIKVHDFEDAEGELFLVMEYAPGGSLLDFFFQDGQLPLNPKLNLA